MCLRTTNANEIKINSVHDMHYTSLETTLLVIPPAFMPTGYIVFVFPFVCSFVHSFVSSFVSYILRQSFG